MRNKIMTFLMSAVSCAAMFCAVMIANTMCPFLSYQDEEPEAVRKLRRF